MRLRAFERPALIGVLALCAVAVACDSTVVTIRGESMTPSYKDGDTVVGLKAVDPIVRGDVVGFRSPNDPSKSFVQRVIGLPGEEIEITNGVVSINGQPIAEPYVAAANAQPFSMSRRRLPDGEFFMMGDNRRNSSDSRSWGTVKRDAIWIKLAAR